MKKNKFILYYAFVCSLLLIGTILAIIQFIDNRSLWADEANIALNIIERKPLELFKPLDYLQVAPVLYLQIINLTSILIPNSEIGLRLFSIICYFLSLILIYRVSFIIAENKWITIFTLTLFVFNFLLLRYSSELKQYICDVFVLLLLLYITLKKHSSTKNKYILLSVTGALCIFLSNVTVFIMVGVGLSVFYSDFIKNKEAKINYLVVLASSWVVSFGIYYILFIHEHPLKGFMVDSWREIGAFLPTNPIKKEFYISLVDLINLVFTRIRFFPRILTLNVYVFYFLTFVAIWALVRKKKFDLLFLLFAPILAHLTLSAVEMYPFHIRLILYIFPLFIIIFTIGLEYLLDIADRFWPKSSKLIIIIILLMVSSSFFHGIKEFYPFRLDEIKDLIEYLDEEIKDDESIYVYRGSHASFKYYQQIGFINFNNQIVFGENNRGNKQAYVAEIKKLRSGSYWFLFTHDDLNEESFIVNSLDSLGFNRKDTFKSSRASLHLYNIWTCNHKMDNRLSH